MHPDELNKPLGLDVGPQAPRREIPWKGLAFAGLGLLGVSVFAFTRLTNPVQPDSFANVAANAPAKPSSLPMQGAGVSLDDETASIASKPRSSGSEVEQSSGVRVVRQGGGGVPGALIITVPQTNIGLTPAPDRRLVEEGRSGQLPKIAADGSKPMNVYARPIVESPKLPPGAPRVAIVIGGMGLNAQATDSAIASLPPAITLAFAPYGRNLAELVAKAREKGHETIVQAPMEGFGGVPEEPGPHVLRTGASAGETLKRLHWHMSRFPGYVGVAGYLGARFTADGDAFGVVMRDISKRGLFYFDDGSSPRSLSATLAAASGAPLVRADVTIDANPAAIDAALAQLEKIARERGFAVGFGAGLPLVIDKAGRFARRLETRGVMLTPVSAMARTPDQASARSDR